MNKYKSDLITGIGTFCILGFILYVAFTGLRPDQLNEKVSEAKGKYDEYVEQFSENYNEAKKEVEDKYGNAVRVESDNTDSEEVEPIKEITTTEERDLETEKVYAEEQAYIGDTKFEVAIGESCDRLHEACGNLRKMIDESNGDSKKINIRQAKKEAEVIIDEYSFITNQVYPKKHKSQLDAFRTYGYGIDETVKDFINNYKEIDAEQYKYTSDSIQNLYNATGNIFTGYRIK